MLHTNRLKNDYTQKQNHENTFGPDVRNVRSGKKIEWDWTEERKAISQTSLNPSLYTNPCWSFFQWTFLAFETAQTGPTTFLA